MEATWQHVLEEATEELKGVKVYMLPGASATVAKGPAQPSIGQELELAVAGGGFEHVTAEVAQSVLAAAGCGAVNHPALLPHAGREVLQRLGHLLWECFPEKRAAAVTQGFDRQEEAESRGGSEQDRAEGRKWRSLFWHEAVVSIPGKAT
jgi:hypothetical protein